VHGEGQVALARAEVGHPQRLLAATGALARAWSKTSMNLLICFHLRDMDGINAPCASVTQVAQEGRDSSR
jgi:ABC-type ATPase involved in cell division